MQISHLGLVPYDKALDIMETWHRQAQQAPDFPGILLVLQHPPTVTMGQRELQGDLRQSPEALQRLGIAYHKIDRGGSVTVHEPGQTVIYPIVRLDHHRLTVKSFVWALEQAMIDTCADFGVQAARDCINPGVWIGTQKIGAIGIRISRKATKHGLAFNVINSLKTFEHVVPCGLRSRGLISLEQALKKDFSPLERQELYANAERLLAAHVEKRLEDAPRASSQDHVDCPDTAALESH